MPKVKPLVVKRSPDERVREFDRAVTEVIAEIGGHTRHRTHIDFRTGEVTQTGPSREHLKSWLIAVRQFDAKDEDVYLPRIVAAILRHQVSSVTREHALLIRRVRQEAHDVVVATDPHGPITGREAFNLLMYGGAVHRNPTRMARLEGLGAMGDLFVRNAGLHYANTIQNLAVRLRVVARLEPSVQHLLMPAMRGMPTYEELEAMNDEERRSVGKRQMHQARRALKRR